MLIVWLLVWFCSFILGFYYLCRFCVHGVWPYMSLLGFITGKWGTESDFVALYKLVSLTMFCLWPLFVLLPSFPIFAWCFFLANSVSERLNFLGSLILIIFFMFWVCFSILEILFSWACLAGMMVFCISLIVLLMWDKRALLSFVLRFDMPFFIMLSNKKVTPSLG